MKNLSEKAILFNLTISAWSATKLDKKVTQEVEKNHNAKDAGRFNKILIAKKDLEKLKSIAQAARTFHYEQTLPWTDSGARLLPAANYFTYVNKLREFKQEFEIAVQNFISVYPELKEDARLRLNGMFNENDYPSIAKLQAKFSFDITPTPMPQLDDFRIAVNQQEVDRLKGEIEQNIFKQISEATKDLWLRVKDAVNHMYEKLSEKDAVFRDSLVENIRDLVDLLPRLNFTSDPDINNVISEMEKLLVNPDDLRKNQIKRNETARNAKELLNKISDFVSDDVLNFLAA